MAYRVLLIDDDEMLRRLVRATLSRDSYDVTEARSGDEGLAAIAEREPDLLILDWHMPDLSGEQVLAVVKHEHRGVRVIVLTAEQRAQERAAATKLGADAFLTKPFSPLGLLAAIEGLLPERGPIR